MHTFHTFVTPVAINIPRQVSHAWNVKRKATLFGADFPKLLLVTRFFVFISLSAQGLLIIRTKTRNLGEVDNKSRSRKDE